MFKLKNILAENGATLSKTGNPVSYPSGYQVSIKDMEIMPVKQLRKKHIVDLLNTIPAGTCLGVWIDKGKAYIDQSAHFDSKRKARQIGDKYNQISIWNWKTSEAVYLH